MSNDKSVKVREPKVYFFNRCREVEIEVDTEEGPETRQCFLASREPIDDDSKKIILKSHHDEYVDTLSL